MFPYQGKDHMYKEALGLKHPKPEPIAQKHHLKQSKFLFVLYYDYRSNLFLFYFFDEAEINMTFDTVEDVAGFTSKVFTSSQEKVFTEELSFMNPRKTDGLFHDYSANCTIM